MKKRLISLILPIIALVLEILPSGAVLNFATPHETYRRTFSYFSLTPFGYANFGPFLAALFTCDLIIICVIFVIRGDNVLRHALTITSLTGLYFSLTPLFYGIRYFSLIGLFISLCLLGEVLVGAILLKKIK